MKLAIMQPYFLPYIGYFQLMRAADLFVYYDDVTFIKQSWINRNRILLDNREHLFTLELEGASSFRSINSISIGNNRSRLMKTFVQAYRKAPYFRDFEPVLHSVFSSTETGLADYIAETHRSVLEYLGVEAKSVRSSSIGKDNSLKGQDKVIDICKRMGAVEYINAPGGRGLYSYNDFSDNGIKLSFLQPAEIRYRQFGNDFIPWLSIIDIIMFNSVAQVNQILDNYTLE
ncbi:MAG: WbqC family protein [Bacteroidales bacterium]|nr:WbqC family protein [Bacteroidales bacterium]